MDRTTRGMIAGIAGGVAMNVWNLSDYYFLHITKIRFPDWFSVLLTWEKPTNSFITVLYLLLQTIIWDGFLGVVLVHLVVSVTSKGIVFKSTFYSLLMWFLFKVTVNFFRVPVLSGKQPYPGGLSNFPAVVVWGVIAGIVLSKLEDWAAWKPDAAKRPGWFPRSVGPAQPEKQVCKRRFFNRYSPCELREPDSSGSLNQRSAIHFILK